jgi:hypothetical protein
MRRKVHSTIGRRNRRIERILRRIRARPWHRQFSRKKIDRSLRNMALANYQSSYLGYNLEKLREKLLANDKEFRRDAKQMRLRASKHVRTSLQARKRERRRRKRLGISRKIGLDGWLML